MTVITNTIATLLSLLYCGSATDATFGRPSTRSWIFCGAWRSRFTSTTIGIGPLKPGPKPSASRS
jgi:hypothetical protein